MTKGVVLLSTCCLLISNVLLGTGETGAVFKLIEGSPLIEVPFTPNPFLDTVTWNHMMQNSAVLSFLDLSELCTSLSSWERDPQLLDLGQPLPLTTPSGHIRDTGGGGKASSMLLLSVENDHTSWLHNPFSGGKCF